jgi:hypothetical protein
LAACWYRRYDHVIPADPTVRLHHPERANDLE